MGQFTIVSPEQDLLIAINETAIGAHWAQNTLDLTWEFLAQIETENLPEDPAAAGRLQRRLQTLNLPNPSVRPVSALAARLNGKRFAVTDGVLSAEVYNFMSGKPVSPIAEFSFAFDAYGCVWQVKGPDGGRPVRVATNGCRFTNWMNGPDSQTQLLICDGMWTGEDTFEMHLRWAETCFTKKLTFHFDGDAVAIEDRDNNAFRPNGQEPGRIAARLIP